MTLPKGFKQKDTKKAKIEDSKSSKENNNKNVNGDSDQIKVTRATTDDFINKQENKIVAENISPKEQVNIDDISVDDGTATVSTVTTTPTPEGEVLSETELKVPMQEREKEVLSETELKVMSAADSSLENEGVSSYSSRSVQNDVNNAASTTTTTATTSSSSNASQVQRDQQHSVNRALDETKNNIRRATDEARKDIPRYTQAANEYQEQTIQTAREIADNFLESQKEIINSLQSAWLPQIDAANRVFVSSWLSPRHLADNYARAVSMTVDNTIAVTRVANNTVFANMEAFKTSIQNARDNVREFSRISVNSARTFEQTSRDTTTRFSY
jgi:vacuolar-type H+-ATPase subunit H